MAKYHVEGLSKKFFLPDGWQLFRIIIIGAVFGILTMVVAGLLAERMATGAESAEISVSARWAAHRMTLVALGLLAMGGLLWLKVESAVLIMIAVVAILWQFNLWVFETNLGMLISVLLAAGLAGVFGWISQLRDSWLRILISVIVVIILSWIGS